MKLLILLILSISTVWAKPIVMISYYDAFGRAPFNNSEIVARALAQNLNSANSPFEVQLCPLNTIFDVAYVQSYKCLKALSEPPLLFLGLGESTCDLKIETMMRNNDRTYGPDNIGNERRNTPVSPGAPAIVGLRYPLPQMYCALNSSERSQLVLSNNAGSFVCNNTAYQMSHNHSDIQYGFIHVPSSHCPDVAIKTPSVIKILSKMIQEATVYLTTGEEKMGLPHPNNDERLSTKKAELKKLRKLYEKEDQCLGEYLNKVKGADEKNGWFGTI